MRYMTLVAVLSILGVVGFLVYVSVDLRRKRIADRARQGLTLADRLAALRTDTEWPLVPHGIRLQVDGMLQHYRHATGHAEDER